MRSVRCGAHGPRMARGAGRRLVAAGAVIALAVAVAGGVWSWRPPHAASQNPDVLLNVLATGARKLNIALPDFGIRGGGDPAGLARQLPQVVAGDLAFSGLFSVVSGQPALPVDNPDAVRQAWADFAAAGAHAGLQGILAMRGNRVELEMRLHDLTSPEQRLIGSKAFQLPAGEARRLAHKVADEVVFQFTGERGIADTKIAYVAPGRDAKEIHLVDYDGSSPGRLTANRSINLSPAWSPDARSVAFTSYMRGYPYLYRLFAFESRPAQLLAGFLGINTSPAWSPDGRQVAMTLSKDGNPDIYVLTLATGAFRRITTHAGIDTEPTWSPTGREIAFISDRAGSPQLHVMDAEGANVRRVSHGGFVTQPRWSPRGDLIVYTAREGRHNIWVIAPDGSQPRRLTNGEGDNQAASWAPNGKHLVFASNRGTGRYRLYTMLVDGMEAQLVPGLGEEATGPAW
jgi:TolB protein